jgi:hypothetical protein
VAFWAGKLIRLVVPIRFERLRLRNVAPGSRMSTNARLPDFTGSPAYIRLASLRRTDYLMHFIRSVKVGAIPPRRCARAVRNSDYTRML